MNPTTMTALLFPGQGSQERGMGRELAERNDDAMALWKKAEAAAGAPLREIYWDGDDDAMADTRHLQAALTVVNVSAYMHLEPTLEHYATPRVLAGHSLGEFSALAVSRALSLSDVIDIVALRGRLMAEADPHGVGAMAAVLKLAQEDVETLVETTRDRLGKILVLANFNSPTQFVVSGEAEAVSALEGPVKEKRGRLFPLPVSGAFHSPLMREAADELAAYMRKKHWKSPKRPVYFNATATTEHAVSDVIETMTRQMTSPVRFIRTVRGMWDAGARQFLELGPKNVLAKLVQQTLKDREETFVTASAVTPQAITAAFGGE